MAHAPGRLLGPATGWRWRLRPTLLLLLLLLLAPAPAPAQDDALEDGQLGARCLRSGRCHVPMSRCENDICVCPQRTVAAAKGRRCLPVAERLGDGCEENAQCAVAHSLCRRPVRACECRRGRVAAGGRCLPEAQLGEACAHPAQCAGLTECSAASRRCVCRGIAFEAGGRCVTDDPDGVVGDWEPPPQQQPPRGPGEDLDQAADHAGTATPLLLSTLLSGVVLLLAWRQVR